jgi:hypothetical protein
MQLDAQREGQLAALESRANAQVHAEAIQSESRKQAAIMAYEQTALKAGLGEKLQERHFRQQLELNRQQAKNKADQWEQQYTAKQRQDMARLNEAKSKIAQNPNFSADERAAAMRAIEMQIAGIQPSMIPRDPNKPDFPDGPPGTVVQKEDGSSFVVEPDGGQRMTVRPDQSKEWLQAKLENEMDIAMLKRQDAAGAYRARLAEKLITKKITTKDGITETEVPAYSPDKIEELVRMAYPPRDLRELAPIEGELVGTPGQQPQPQAEPAPRQEPPEVQRARAALEAGPDRPFEPGGEDMSQRRAEEVVREWENSVAGVRGNLPKVAGQAEYDRLPAGVEYIAPNGQRYRKR